jgi:hypothetical protein
MRDGANRGERTLEGGWCLQGIGDAQHAIRLVFGDTELARAYPGLVIGRHPALCERVVDDLTISQRHCRFSVREQQLLVEDLNSMNGTLIDGKDIAPFRPVPVTEGQTVMLGRLPMSVRRIPPGAGLR